MAYIEKTAFEPRITNNEYNELCNITGRYQVSEADADCSAGLLVVRGEQLPCAGFKGVKNENAFYMNAAGAAANADTGVYACNTYEWPTLGGRNGNNYAVGTATLGLGVPAGRAGTITENVSAGQPAARIGEGNVNGAIGENTIFTIANGLLVPAAAAPTATGAIYFKLKGTGNFTEGAGQSFVYYDVWACKVSTVTA